MSLTPSHVNACLERRRCSARCGCANFGVLSLYSAYLLVQCGTGSRTAWTRSRLLLHDAPVRVLTHIKRLDDCFGDFLVRVICQRRSHNRHA